MKTRPLFRRLHAAVWVGLFAAYGGVGSLLAGVTFGESMARCDAAFGPTVPVPNATFLVCAETHGYVRDGVSILIGFDEKGKAEEFIYSKIAAPGEVNDLTEAECQALLDQYKEDSTWLPATSSPNGPVWRREDNGAYASYVQKGSRLVILSNAAMGEHVKKFKVEDK